MSLLRQSSTFAFAIGAALLAAGAAQAASYTVTLTNGTSFETRYKPMSAEWDPNYAMLRTDQGNWIALKKSEIVDVTAASELSGFGYQINDTTVFLGWSASEGLVATEEAANAANNPNGAAPGAAPAGQPAADAGGGDAGAAGGGYTMQQFVSVPTSGVIPGGIPLGGGSSAGGTTSGRPGT